MYIGVLEIYYRVDCDNDRSEFLMYYSPQRELILVEMGPRANRRKLQTTLFTLLPLIKEGCLQVLNISPCKEHERGTLFDAQGVLPDLTNYTEKAFVQYNEYMLYTKGNKYSIQGILPKSRSVIPEITSKIRKKQDIMMRGFMVESLLILQVLHMTPDTVTVLNPCGIVFTLTRLQFKLIYLNQLNHLYTLLDDLKNNQNKILPYLIVPNKLYTATLLNYFYNTEPDDTKNRENLALILSRIDKICLLLTKNELIIGQSRLETNNLQCEINQYLTPKNVSPFLDQASIMSQIQVPSEIDTLQKSLNYRIKGYFEILRENINSNTSSYFISAIDIGYPLRESIENVIKLYHHYGSERIAESSVRFTGVILLERNLDDIGFTGEKIDIGEDKLSVEPGKMPELKYFDSRKVAVTQSPNATYKYLKIVLPVGLQLYNPKTQVLKLPKTDINISKGHSKEGLSNKREKQMYYELRFMDISQKDLMLKYEEPYILNYYINGFNGLEISTIDFQGMPIRLLPNTFLGTKVILVINENNIYHLGTDSLSLIHKQGTNVQYRFTNKKVDFKIAQGAISVDTDTAKYYPDRPKISISIDAKSVTFDDKALLCVDNINEVNFNLTPKIHLSERCLVAETVIIPPKSSLIYDRRRYDDRDYLINDWLLSANTIVFNQSCNVDVMDFLLRCIHKDYTRRSRDNSININLPLQNVHFYDFSDKIDFANILNVTGRHQDSYLNTVKLTMHIHNLNVPCKLNIPPKNKNLNHLPNLLSNLIVVFDTICIEAYQLSKLGILVYVGDTILNEESELFSHLKPTSPLLSEQQLTRARLVGANIGDLALNKLVNQLESFSSPIYQTGLTQNTIVSFLDKLDNSLYDVRKIQDLVSQQYEGIPLLNTLKTIVRNQTLDKLQVIDNLELIKDDLMSNTNTTLSSMKLFGLVGDANNTPKINTRSIQYTEDIEFDDLIRQYASIASFPYILDASSMSIDELLPILNKTSRIKPIIYIYSNILSDYKVELQDLAHSNKLLTAKNLSNIYLVHRVLEVIDSNTYIYYDIYRLDFKDDIKSLSLVMGVLNGTIINLYSIDTSQTLDKFVIPYSLTECKQQSKYTYSKNVLDMLDLYDEFTLYYQGITIQGIDLSIGSLEDDEIIKVRLWVLQSLYSNLLYALNQSKFNNFDDCIYAYTILPDNNTKRPTILEYKLNMHVSSGIVDPIRNVVLLGKQVILPSIT